MEFDGTFLIAAISFIVFVFIMNKVFYEPVFAIMKKRFEITENNFKAAEIMHKEIKSKEEYHSSKLEAARADARAEIDSHTKKIDGSRNQIITEFKQQLAAEAEQEKKNLRKSAFDAREALKDSAGGIAAEISNILLGNMIDTSLIKNRRKEE